MSTCTLEGPHLVENCAAKDRLRWDVSVSGVVTHDVRPPKPPAPSFPPRDLHACQEVLRNVAGLLDLWHALGKADGVHGAQLRTALYGPREES